MMKSDYSNLKEITICEVCDNTELTSVLNLGLHPMCDDLVEVGNDRICKEYPIEILFCDRCSTAHQKYQIPKGELFPRTYHYRSRFTADVLKGMADLVKSTKETFGNLENKKILDIGCNDGSLLDLFKSEGAITFGIEPTDAFQDALNKGHKVMNAFLSIESAEEFYSKFGTVDFICFTNVFAHIENLKEVIDSLKKLLNPETVIIIENHYLGSVLKTSQFDTFYHEHPRTYSYQSFVFIAESLGLALLSVEFPSRYGGNIRVYIGNKSKKKSDLKYENVIENEKQFSNQFAQMNKQIANWIKTKTEFIKEFNLTNGKIIAKAFPGRAAILVKLLELSDDQVECVYEKPGSMKIGHYLPGTRIRIDSDNELFTDINKEKTILNLAWHIQSEIKNYLNENGYSGEIVDIISQKDF